MSVVIRSRCCNAVDHHLRPGNGSHAAALHCSCGRRLRWIKPHQLPTFQRQYSPIEQVEKEQQLGLEMGGEANG